MKTVYSLCLAALFSLIAGDSFAAAAPAQTNSTTWTDPSPYIQKDSTGSTTATNVYDDLVRYKTRAQLQTFDDQYNFSYQGPQIAVALGDHIRLFSYQCGKLVSGDKIDMASEATRSAHAWFTPGNRHLFVYSPQTGTGTCGMYTISGTNAGTCASGTCTGTTVTTNDYTSARTSVIQGCPDDPGGGLLNIATSANGYLALTKSASPYVEVSRLRGNLYYALPPLDAAGGIPTARPTMLSFTGDGTMLIMSGGTSATTKVYARTAYDKFVQIGYAPFTNRSQPVPPTTPLAVAFSPNGKYLAIPSYASNVVTINLWRIDANYTFTAISAGVPTIAVTGANQVNAMTFSPDSQYLAIAGSDGSAANSYIRIYKIDSGDSFVAITPTLGGVASANPYISALAFAPDSSYLIAAIAYSGTHPMILPINRITPTQWGAYSGLQLQWTGASGYMPKSIAVHR